MDNAIAVRDALYVLFGVIAVAGTLYAIRTGNAKASGDDRERIVRIDENTKELRSDVADIKAEMRQTKTSISDHERRIIVLETENQTQWQRIDELKAAHEERNQ